MPNRSQQLCLLLLSALAALALSSCAPAQSPVASIPQAFSDEGDTHEGLVPDEDQVVLPVEPVPGQVVTPPNVLIPGPGEIPALVTGETEQAKGAYASGKLVSPNAIPLEGPGFVKLFADSSGSSARGFGTVDLISIVQHVSARMAQAYPEGERVQVGDLSAERGGSVSGHSSHQNGLDVDLGYFRRDRREGLDESSFVEEFVKDGELTENFDLERNWALMKAWVSTGRVNRIFVDAAIKKAFCAHSKELGDYADQIETLRRLRPWPHHGDHHHLRISCPANSPSCKPQAEVSSGSGC
jgi:penicillin-insensitive murein endopeptidase